jgi:hypothetical protein
MEESAMDGQRRERNRYIAIIGLCVCSITMLFIVHVLHAYEMPSIARRALIWIPVLPIWFIVGRVMQKSGGFIPMNFYVEYGLFISMSFLFIVGPTLESYFPWMGPLISLVWLIPLGYLYYHKRNKYE